MPASLSNNSHRRHSYVTRKFAKGACRAVSCQGVGIAARRTGFKKRASTFRMAPFYRAVLEVAGEGGEFSIAAIHRRYAALSGDDIRYKPFHNRVRQDECVDFFTWMAARQVDSMLRVSSFPDGVQLLSMLRAAGINVRDVQCQDGTYWNVSSGLACTCPGSRTAAKAETVPDTYGEDGNPVTEKPECAQIGIQFRTSVVSRCIVEAPVTSARANEKDYMDVDKDNPVLLLMDNGYQDFKRLASIGLKGSFFIIKGRSNTAGSIVSCTVGGRPHPEFQGMKLTEIRHFRPAEMLDAKVAFKGGAVFRVVRFYNKTRRCLVYLITNIGSEHLGAHSISCLYRIRWKCEEIYKDLKSGCNLRSTRTAIPNIIYVEIAASISAYLLKLLAANAAGRILRIQASLHKIEQSTGGWYAAFLGSLLKGDIGGVREAIRKPTVNNENYTMNRQSSRAHMLNKTTKSVLDDIRKDLVHQGKLHILEAA